MTHDSVLRDGLFWQVATENHRFGRLGWCNACTRFIGFGNHSVIHTAKILRLLEDLPIVIEIDDSLEYGRVDSSLLDQMIRAD